METVVSHFKKKLAIIVLSISVLVPAHANLIVNSSFESGDFSGWVVTGTSIQNDVARDGDLLLNAGTVFGDSFQNVRTGNFAGNALVCCNAQSVQAERILLSQSVDVNQNTDYDIGFWLSNDSDSDVGLFQSNEKLQIFVNGIGVLTEEFIQLNKGNLSSDFTLFSSMFNSGTATMLDLTFAVTASGTERFNVSFDDFYLRPTSVSTPHIKWLLFLIFLWILLPLNFSKS
jgi:hypothetical protein